MGTLLPSAHAVEREFRVQHALFGGPVPVSRVHALCEDDAIIGSAFYVMDFVPGRIFWDQRLPEQTRSERVAIFDSMNATIARLHTIDPVAVGLGDFGRAGNFMERQVARWTKQYYASETEQIEAMDRLMVWLADRSPPASEVRIVHGDFRLDNLTRRALDGSASSTKATEVGRRARPIAEQAWMLARATG
jgi:aminoglycoside phosphotransferase (APT) family kinase protein